MLQRHVNLLQLHFRLPLPNLVYTSTPRKGTRQDGGQGDRDSRLWTAAETGLATVAAGFPSFHGGLGARRLTGPLNNERNV